MDQFNYQLVFKDGENRIIFAGTTNLLATDLVVKCARELVNYDKLDFFSCLESFIYQPLKNEEE